MIDLEERFDTVEEMQAFLRGILPQNIYDDIELLQQQMAEVLSTLDTLNSDFVPEQSVNLNDADLNDQIGKVIIGYGNACVNRPTTQNGYLINIPHNSAPERYGKQIWITRPSNNVFIRSLEDGTFTDWAYVYYDTSWKDLPLATGVTYQNATDYPCRYRRLGNVVYVEGCVKGFAEIEKVIATLPEGFRPNKSYYFQSPTNAGKTDTFRIYTTGSIQRIATTNTPAAADNYHFINTSFVAN